MQNSQPEEDEVPKGVVLRDFDDFNSLRTNIFDGVKNAMVKSFPVDYGNVRLELHDVDYDNIDDVPISEQKKNLLENKYITKKLRGTIKLYDKTTDELLEEKRLSLMRVPYLTNRGTFIHGGNEYATIMQSRLLPGVYTRRQANGELETQFNVKPGTGVGFRVGFEPETTQYRVKISQANLHMYSLMHDLGTPDDDLKKAWGPEIFNANKAKYDARVFDKAYDRLVSNKQKKLDTSTEDKIKSVKAALEAAKIHARVAQKNLPNMFDPKVASEWEARWQGKQAMEKLASENIDSIPFEPDLTPKEAAETFIDEDVLDAVENEKSAGLFSKIIPAVKNVASSSVRSSPFDATIKRIGSGLKWNKIESINPVDRIKNLNSSPAHLWRGHDWLNPAQISKRNWSNTLPWENKTYEGYMHGTPILSETTGYGAGIGVKGKFRESRVPDTHAKLISQYEASPSTLYGGPQDISKNNLQLWDKIKSDYQDNPILHNMYEAPIVPGTKPLSSGLLKQVDGSYYYAPTSHMDDWQKVMTDIGDSEDLMRQFRFSSAWDDIFQGTNKSAADMHALMQARKHSAQAKEEYKRKTAIMAAALAKFPDEFIVDQDGAMSGVTHLPSGFRIHVPRKVIPSNVKRVFQEDLEDDE